ncbi:ubiquinol--cytochrome-c reductase subunit 8 [Eutypa lata]|uniref:Cytochrome b-c1 complex subunit 8 n=1 Tax=Eutypa lata (strain UCR-EL1) TaxID=1287681 RepID=M7T7D8_EUTLA|nr:putative ubiquinol-cytochrome c reductase complex ubiquinone-binding protein [Eutypa lata UCREL1]KAI1250787.1 ubiquinol--cytochrome-c reductase subunit 8 [Eutypa lata]
MRPTQILRAGAETPLGKYEKFLGTWGHFGGMKQRGIISYAMSPNRQNPLAGAAHAAVFNSWRRFRNQVLYWAPPMVFFYYTMEWAIERNEYLNSKAGRKEYAGSE